MASMYFSLHKIFYNPPGTPQNLKCVGCSVAAAGASLTLSTAVFYKAKRVIAKSLYPGAGLMILGANLAIFGLFAGRKAYSDTQYNDRLIRIAKEDLKKIRRQEKSGVGKPIQYV